MTERKELCLLGWMGYLEKAEDSHILTGAGSWLLSSSCGVCGLSYDPALGHRTQGPGLLYEEQDETHLLISCWLIRLLYLGWDRGPAGDGASGCEGGDIRQHRRVVQGWVLDSPSPKASFGSLNI